MADQPERNLMKKVREKEKSKRALQQQQLAAGRPTMASTSFDAFQHHLATPPLNFSAEMSHFLASGGASSFADFSEPGSVRGRHEKSPNIKS